MSDMDVSNNKIFIETLKRHPEIYDTRLKEYKDSKAKENAWEDLSVTMEMSVEECMRRWRYLRDKYCREKKAAQMYDLQHPNSVAKTTSSLKRTWPFYHCMSFLDAHIKHRIFFKSYGHQPFVAIDPSTPLQASDSILGESDQDSIGSYAVAEPTIDIKQECMSPRLDGDVKDGNACGGGSAADQELIENKNDILNMCNYSLDDDTSREINDPGVIGPDPTTLDDVDEDRTAPHEDDCDHVNALMMTTTTTSSAAHLLRRRSRSPPTSPSTSTASRDHKRFRDDLQTELMEVIRATQVTINDIIRKKHATHQVEDEDDLFGRTIAASLKTFSSIKRLQAKASIFQLLLQLQQSEG